MSRLQSTISKKNTAVQESEQGQAESRMPSFNEKGTLKRPERKKVAKRIIVIVGILACIAAFLYIPQLFVHETVTDVTGDLPVNADAITLISKANSTDWVEDYDGDGLDNQEETNFQTDQYNIDTDGDAMTDYAEVYITKTSPITPDDTLLSNCVLNDELNGTTLSTPYKIGNVILWADDYSSKAYGSVVETLNGYRFCGFSGYAQFTLYDGWYAYKIENGIHVPLPYRTQEKVWHVSAGDEVVLYSQPLEERIMFNIFGSKSYAQVNTFTNILNAILPENGFITAKKVTNADVVEITPNVVMADLVSVPYDREDAKRFSKNCSAMSDIMFVRDAIDNNECVAVTIFHESIGEKTGIVFGYYDDNTLLVADPDTLEYVGNIQITERARMMITETGETKSYEYFTFNGFGASTRQGFRINFFQ